MKTSLAFQRPDYGSPTLAEKPEKMVTEYPRLRIELSPDNQDILSKLPKTGEAKISFKVKSLRLGQEYGPADSSESGEVCLEVTAIELEDKAKPAFKDAGDALDAFARDRKADKSQPPEEEEGDE